MTDISHFIDNPDGEKKGPTLLSVEYPTKQALYSAYMPFIKQAALFIPTNKEFDLGDKISLILTLVGDPDKHSIDGEVVWRTPPGATGGAIAGIGVQFTSDNGKEVRKKIETHLAGLLNSEDRTDTM